MPVPVTFIAAVEDEDTRKVYKALSMYPWVVTTNPNEIRRLILNSKYVVYLGHGERDSLIVGDQKVIEACRNDSLLTNKSVMLISCKTGSVLLRSAASKGPINALGFKRSFFFLSDDRYPPEKDPYLHACLAPVKAAIDAFYVTGDVRAAKEAFKKATRLVRHELASKRGSDIGIVDAFLMWNEENLETIQSIAMAETPWWIWAIPIAVMTGLAVFFASLRMIRGG